jgi:uncharacterized protein (TIGR00251 family)
MKLTIRVKANARENRVEALGKNEYRVIVKAPAKEGRANEAVIEVLSEHFGVAKSRFEITGGLQSKNKIVLMRE